MAFIDKVYNSLTSITEIVKLWQTEGKTVVFTNGCFDLLHSGHVQYLEEAKSKGDKLIVAINSDASVKKLKGKHRPINDEKSRATVLAALASTDAIFVFHEDTPYEVIKSILPNILVKGGDWNIDQIVGSDIVIENGGAVYSLSFVEGSSTTNIEKKIIDSFKESIA